MCALCCDFVHEGGGRGRRLRVYEVYDFEFRVHTGLRFRLHRGFRD